MFGLIAVILIIVSVILMLLVLIQPGKGDMLSGMGGLTGQFSSLFGTRKASNLLTKLTAWFAGAIIVISLLANLFFLSAPEVNTQRPVTEGATVPQSQRMPNQTPQLPAPTK